MQQVAIDPVLAGPVMGLLGPDRAEHFQAVADQARIRLAGRTVWNVSSTAAGGGVAEMLRGLVGYVRGLGIATGWLVIDGTPEFFAITKRLHNALHGSVGDGSELGAAQRAAYEAVQADNLPALIPRIMPGDVVVLHDPQTAGLRAGLERHGAQVIWRCHVGSDLVSDQSELGWEFLRHYVEPARALVFSRRSYPPAWVDPARLHVVPPSIDPFSAKNAELPSEVGPAILVAAGLIAAESPPGAAVFPRRDGSTGQVRRQAEVVREGGLLAPRVPLVVQVSRWDRLKDMAGVLRAFAEYVEDAHLALVGPDVTSVADDPEGRQVLGECVAAWHGLAVEQRRRVSLVSLPMVDLAENAAIVNALQRHAAVVTQKSLVEGFGLTVAEAMWKARPMVASNVGGIADQIEDERSGLLLDDPRDLAGFGAAVRRLLSEPALAERLGSRARERVQAQFLPDRQLEQWAEVLAAVDDAGRVD